MISTGKGGARWSWVRPAGLGRTIAQALVEHGATVGVAARDAEKLQHAAKEVGAHEAWTCDVTDSRQVQSVFERVADAWQGLDLLVNCVGKSARGNIEQTSAAEFQALLDVNFLGTVRSVQAALPLLEQNHGAIINIGSLAAKTASPYLGAYPASKFPLVAYSQQLMMELEEKGIHVLLVCPGPHCPR